VRVVSILGSTGSIGASTLDVVARHPERFRVFAIAANSSDEAVVGQCVRFKPRYAVLVDEEAARRCRHQVRALGLDVEVLSGEHALEEIAAAPEVHTVMAAIVGAAGLRSTLAAARAGKRILLANKEALVMSGRIFMDAVNESGAQLLPVDSEHNAVFQSLPADRSQGLHRAGVQKITLTASGGPFRTWPIERMAWVSPDEACRHPNWVMGRKISVDSATMMNKGLEVIEACWLFGAGAEQVEILIHPESIVHSMVSYLDGSVIAQLSCPDMRTPIAHALAFPERIEAGVANLDLVALGRLTFEAVDRVRFPCVDLAYDAIRRGGTAAAVLNAANEIAVEAFLGGRLQFTGIPALIEGTLAASEVREVSSLQDVIEADFLARTAAREWLGRSKRAFAVGRAVE
jgi:1-deoxy-D-xylulose-5-phosphate reductoisomerase